MPPEPAAPASTQTWLGYLIFMSRCAGAASLSYFLAKSIGLHFPVWAAMSSVIVAQDRLDDTKLAVWRRVAGSLVGISAAMLIGSLLRWMAAGIELQILCAVAVCAAIAHRWPNYRVAMWTAPIIFLSSGQQQSLFQAGASRALEVLLGCAVGAVFHWTAEWAMRQVHGWHARRMAARSSVHKSRPDQP